MQNVNENLKNISKHAKIIKKFVSYVLCLNLLVACSGTGDDAYDTSRTDTEDSQNVSSSSGQTNSNEPIIQTPTNNEPNTPTIDRVSLGEVAFEHNCIGCHSHQGYGVFGVGGFSFNVNAFTFSSKTQFTMNYDSSTVQGLELFIHNEMPSPGLCTDECAQNTAAYLWSFKASTPAAGTPPEMAASCESQGQLIEPQLRRLTEQQIQNSVTDIFGDIFEVNDWPEMKDGGSLLGMSYSADRLQMNSINTENLYKSSRRLVKKILADNSVINNCAQSSISNCITDTIADFGLQLWRRPLTASEINNLVNELSPFTSNEEKLEFVFNYLLLNHNFLFRSEIGKINNGVSDLTNYEIASALSYSVWNSTPDATLLALASQSSPLTESDIKSQIDRMILDSRANDAFLEIYKDYLKLDLVLTQDKLEELNFSPSIRNDTLNSAEMMLQDKISQNLNYMSIFLGNGYYVNNNIQSLFGLDGFSSNLEISYSDASERDGILNHPAFLAGHSTLASSGIVQRGVFTLEQILCNDIPKAPDNVASIEAPSHVNPETTSTRELLQITHSAQEQCRSCHQFIDPAGFGYENFDNLGQYRTIEKDVVPIDASGELSVGSEVLSYSNSAEYSRALANSLQMKQCVSQRFLEHYIGKTLEADSCELSAYRSILGESNQGVIDLIYSLIKLESFSKRTTVQ